MNIIDTPYHQGLHLTISTCSDICEEGIAHLGRVVTKIKGLKKCTRLITKIIDFSTFVLNQPYTPLQLLHDQLKNFSGVIKALKIIDDIHAWIGSDSEPIPFWKNPDISVLTIFHKFFSTGKHVCNFLEFLDSSQLLKLTGISAAVGQFSLFTPMTWVPFYVVKDAFDLIGSLFGLMDNTISVIKSLKSGEIIEFKFRKRKEENDLITSVLNGEREQEVERQNLLKSYKAKIDEGQIKMFLLSLQSKFSNLAFCQKIPSKNLDFMMGQAEQIKNLKEIAHIIQEQAEKMFEEEWDIGEAKLHVREWEEEIWKFMDNYEKFNQLSKSMDLDQSHLETKEKIVQYILSVLEKTNHRLDECLKEYTSADVAYPPEGDHLEQYQRKIKEWTIIFQAINEPTNLLCKDDVEKLLFSKKNKLSKVHEKMKKDRKALQLSAAYRTGKIFICLLRLGLLIGLGGSIYLTGITVLCIGTYSIGLYKYLWNAKKVDLVYV